MAVNAPVHQSGLSIIIASLQHISWRKASWRRPFLLQSCSHFPRSHRYIQAAQIILLSALLSAAAPAPSFAKATSYSWGAWEVAYNEATHDSMGYCDATGWSNGGGQAVSVLAYDDGAVYLMFFDSAWQMTPGQLVHGIVSVDKTKWTIAGETRASSIHVPLNDGRIPGSTATDFLDALTRGTAIALNAEGWPIVVHHKPSRLGGRDQRAHGLRGICSRASGSLGDAFRPARDLVTWGINLMGNTGRAWVRIVGEVTDRTFKDFMRAVESAEKAHTALAPIEVTLESPGGDLYNGIAIGEAIRARQWSTVVEGTCASVCALMWLGGADLWVSPEARIGLHQAYYGDGEVTVFGQRRGWQLPRPNGVQLRPSPAREVMSRMMV